MTFMVYVFSYLMVGISVSTMFSLWLNLDRKDAGGMFMILILWPAFVAIVVGASMFKFLKHMTKENKK